MSWGFLFGGDHSRDDSIRSPIGSEPQCRLAPGPMYCSQNAEDSFRGPYYNRNPVNYRGPYDMNLAKSMSFFRRVAVDVGILSFNQVTLGLTWRVLRITL